MKAFWNERYGGDEYVYGQLPNEYFKTQLATLPPGKILLPAEGEGRNAVYAAAQGWDVYAFDQSEAGQRKAMALARKANVKIHYDVLDVREVSFPPDTFDAIALIFAHFPASIRPVAHQLLIPLLRPGGTLIFEAFSKQQIYYQRLNPNAGGPRDTDMLFDETELRREFEGITFTKIEEKETILDEGPHHSGKGMVLRGIGTKL